MRRAVVGTGDFARRTFPYPLTRENAEQVLLRTNVFALGLMPPKRQVPAFNVIYDLPDAAERFRVIGTRANAPGQLYALAALTLLDPSHAAHFAATLGGRDEDVLVYDPDVFRELSMTHAIALVERRRVADECRRLRDVTDEYFRRRESGR